VNAKNSDGQTAYDIAEKFAHFNLLEYLKSIGAKRGKEMKLKTSSAVNMLFKAGGKPAYPVNAV
jgi:ankyrin repeat protein